MHVGTGLYPRDLSDVVDAILGSLAAIAFRIEIAQLSAGGRESYEIPRRLVDAEQVLPSLAAEWQTLLESPPEKLTVVSPVGWKVLRLGPSAAVFDRLSRPSHIEFRSWCGARRR